MKELLETWRVVYAATLCEGESPVAARRMADYAVADMLTSAKDGVFSVDPEDTKVWGVLNG